MKRAATAYAAVFSIAALIAGCSSLKPYPGASPENLVVSSAIESGSAERAAYLVFVFEGSSFLGGSSSSSSSGALLKPRAGYRYEVAVTYRDSIYNVVLRESDPRKGAFRELPRQELKGCKASS